MNLTLHTHPVDMEGKFAAIRRKLVSFSFFFSVISTYHVCIHRLPQSTTMEIRIPSNAVGKVMGRGGGNLDNIRRVCFIISFPSSFLSDHHIPSFVSLSFFLSKLTFFT